MPNSSVIEQRTQTADSSNSQHLSPPPKVSIPSTPLQPTPSNSELKPDEWSSFTKELIDTLPRVWTRGLLYFIVIFVAIILPWSMLSKVDETGSARGRLEPEGKSLTLDAPVAGTVAALKVEEGQSVEAGQIILEFESEIIQQELQQAQARLEGQRNRLAQLVAVQNQLEMAIRTSKQQNQAQESEQLANLDQIQRQLSSSRKIHLMEKERLAVAQNDVHRHRQLWHQGAIAKIKLEEIENVMRERQQLLEQAQSDLQEAATELEKQQSAYERIQRTGELAVLESEKQLKELQTQLVETRSEIAQTREQIKSLQFQLQQQVLRAPIDGTVFQLALDNAGTVLQPGEIITQIAPEGVPLVFRAQMPVSESGFLRVGMPVKLKFDAYPFQDYGIIPGRLRWISPDSKVEETEQGTVETFELEIELDQNQIQAQNRRVALTPGQTATAEVVVRQRRVIDFVIDPFKKLQKGGLEL